MKQVTGTFQRVGGGGVFKVGVPGMADIGGWVADEEYSWAIPFQVEVKTGSAQPNRRQVDFAKACDVSGCFHILADFRHPEDSKYVDSRIVDVVCNLQTASLSKLSGMAPF